MPVKTKVSIEKIEEEFNARVARLGELLKSRPLKSASEGAARGSWIRPGDMRATTGTALELRLAVEDFKAILSEIKALK